MALHKLAELFAIFVFHVHEFDAVTFGTDIADYGGEVNFAKAGTDLELDGIANGELARRFEICAAETNSPDAG